MNKAVVERILTAYAQSPEEIIPEGFRNKYKYALLIMCSDNNDFGKISDLIAQMSEEARSGIPYTVFGKMMQKINPVRISSILNDANLAKQLPLILDGIIEYSDKYSNEQASQIINLVVGEVVSVPTNRDDKNDIENKRISVVINLLDKRQQDFAWQVKSDLKIFCNKFWVVLLPEEKSIIANYFSKNTRPTDSVTSLKEKLEFIASMDFPSNGFPDLSTAIENYITIKTPKLKKSKKPAKFKTNPSKSHRS